MQPDGVMVDVDDSNLEEYLERVLELTLGSGIQQQIKAFQDGESTHLARFSLACSRSNAPQASL